MDDNSECRTRLQRRARVVGAGCVWVQGDLETGGWGCAPKRSEVLVAKDILLPEAPLKASQSKCMNATSSPWSVPFRPARRKSSLRFNAGGKMSPSKCSFPFAFCVYLRHVGYLLLRKLAVSARPMALHRRSASSHQRINRSGEKSDAAYVSFHHSLKHQSPPCPDGEQGDRPSPNHLCPSGRPIRRTSIDYLASPSHSAVERALRVRLARLPRCRASLRPCRVSGWQMCSRIES